MTANPQTRTVFTYLTGQYDNVGDALLRRGLVESFPEIAEWRVYLGNAPSDYIDALRLPEGARVYSSVWKWLGHALLHMGRHGKAAFLGNPGEISSTRTELALGLISATIMAVGRAARNPGLRLGVGARDRRLPYSIGHDLATRLAALISWRDAESKALFERGAVAPDWAFALQSTTADGPRGLVALSYRGDRPLPTEHEFLELNAWCERNHLRPTVVTQVRRDEQTNAKIAQILDCEHIYPSTGTLTEIEGAVRRTYGRSAIVLSNRIHVLIAGAIEGAAPAALLGHADIKVERTFRGANVGCVVRVPGATLSVGDFMDLALTSAHALPKALESARRSLSQLRDEAAQVLQPDTRKTSAP